MRTPLTVTVDPETVKAAEAASPPGERLRSAHWVAEAMTERARRERLAEIRAELGPATSEETASAQSVLGL
jgi:hypothetical protein